MGLGREETQVQAGLWEDWIAPTATGVNEKNVALILHGLERLFKAAYENHVQAQGAMTPIEEYITQRDFILTGLSILGGRKRDNSFNPLSLPINTDKLGELRTLIPSPNAIPAVIDNTSIAFDARGIEILTKTKQTPEESERLSGIAINGAVQYLESCILDGEDAGDAHPSKSAKAFERSQILQRGHRIALNMMLGENVAKEYPEPKPTFSGSSGSIREEYIALHTAGAEYQIDRLQNANLALVNETGESDTAVNILRPTDLKTITIWRELISDYTKCISEGRLRSMLSTLPRNLTNLVDGLLIASQLTRTGYKDRESIVEDIGQVGFNFKRYGFKPTDGSAAVVAMNVADFAIAGYVLKELYKDTETDPREDKNLEELTRSIADDDLRSIVTNKITGFTFVPVGSAPLAPAVTEAASLPPSSGTPEPIPLATGPLPAEAGERSPISISMDDVNKLFLEEMNVITEKSEVGYQDALKLLGSNTIDSFLIELIPAHLEAKHIAPATKRALWAMGIMYLLTIENPDEHTREILDSMYRAGNFINSKPMVDYNKFLEIAEAANQLIDEHGGNASQIRVNDLFSATQNDYPLRVPLDIDGLERPYSATGENISFYPVNNRQNAQYFEERISHYKQVLEQRAKQRASKKTSTIKE